MTNTERIISSLSNVELCDDCLSVSSGIFPRNAVNSICRSLHNSSKINRHHGVCDHCHKTKFKNLLLECNINNEISIAEVSTSPISNRPWYWEVNVQNHLVKYLISNSYNVSAVANTAARTQGIDIIAHSSEGEELWVSLKGYPNSNNKFPNNQARHRFSRAIFDLVLYHEQNSNVNLAISLPERFTTYINLLPRVKWLKETIPFKVYWVNENGKIRVE
ncbi:hypothetical protein PMSD_01195 [Paenibacillus macquariensis subsp. defensor]|nr:hypothetical protein PMSD_01195 [Paenibacillus macquariensis subsp. defensor]